jgi:hypothetical protein
VFGADLLFQIDFLLGQLVLQFGQFPIGLRVLHGDRDLLGDLAEQFDLFGVESILAASAQIQRAQHAVVDRRPAKSSPSATSILRTWTQHVFPSCSQVRPAFGWSSPYAPASCSLNRQFLLR